MVRAFIAVELSKEIRDKIAEAGASLKGGGRITPVSPENMHITLKFLGDVSDAEIEIVKEELQKLHGSPFSLTAAKVSAFGHPVRVVKAEVSDCGNCASLAAQIETSLAARGFAREDKKFSPHITIARVKEYSPVLLPKISAIADMQFGICTISEICLKQSILTPSGPIYKTLFEVAL